MVDHLPNNFIILHEKGNGGVIVEDGMGWG